jgi:hypothetical protein
VRKWPKYIDLGFALSRGATKRRVPGNIFGHPVVVFSAQYLKPRSLGVSFTKVFSKLLWISFFFFCSPQLDTISNTRSQIKIKIPFFERDKYLTPSLLYIQVKVLPLIKEVLYSSKRASGICRSKTGCSEGPETSWFCKTYQAAEKSV